MVCFVVAVETLSYSTMCQCSIRLLVVVVKFVVLDGATVACCGSCRLFNYQSYVSSLSVGVIPLFFVVSIDPPNISFDVFWLPFPWE